ncbi:recombination protein NinG [Pseudomonas sp. 5P_3.1_Bac2]|uniref:recombination protein NinG n=1 Tax=Pseudomonas sp. 5P_3.1_Bac2 TaxID=2971617 RepID=UPI0021C95AE5|nr:recombination protein NinG [Pseudomonas sp. 5P_3.1_Bac2]MCU1717333.1 recombination protein NinG [Pseudomonas sp. 5P_3.1_Bac2]
MTLSRKPLKPASGKPKKCRHCKGAFVPAKPLQVACGVPCAVALAKAAGEKERKSLAQLERKELKAAKERIKSRGEHLKEAQAAFNEWVRLRDADQPCISCGTFANVQYAAGHYRTVAAAPELRFEPLNVHKQCNKNCNKEKSGNIVGYRVSLVRKIGADAVEWLEGPHEPKKYTIDEIKAIKAHYRALVRDLQRVTG